MRIDRTLFLTALGAIGAALLTFPFLPGSWPNPLPEGSRLGTPGLQQLRAAAARVDHACEGGDLPGFDEAVTPALVRRLKRQLEVLSKPLDAATLRQFRTERAWSFADILDLPVLASEVRGGRAAVAVDRPAGDGAQLLEFVWDGRRLRLDDSRHAAEAGTEQRARALVVDAVMKKKP